MVLERREPLAQGTGLVLKKEDGGEVKFAMERVICYGENSIAYIGSVCSTPNSFAKKAVLKEFYPVSAPENGVYRDPESGSLVLPEHRETDFTSKGRELFEGTFPFTGVAEQNNTVYTYTDVNEVITLHEWKEEGRQLAGEDIAQIMSLVCAYLQKIHDRGALYLNCSPESIYLIRGEGAAPGEACMFDFDAVRSRNSADYQYHSYMDGWAPVEQYYGEKRYIDVQADVYAAGAVFFWMLTGKKVDIEADHDVADSSFLWNSFVKLVEDSDTNVRIIKKILLNSLHNAWSSRYIHIAAMKKDFDRLARKYKDAEEKNIKDVVEAVIDLHAADITEDQKFGLEDKEYPYIKEENLADMDIWNKGHYYANGIHSEDYPNGDCYEGEWRNGKYHGNGMFQWKNGDVYEGSWMNGLQNGYGQFKYTNGDVYEGEWLEGKRSGKGKMIYGKGFIYEGEWLNDERSGKGKLIHAEKGFIYEGDWVNNVVTGNGKVISNNMKYEGEWLRWKYHGIGKLICANGAIYEGSWTNGQRNGHGRFQYVNGDVYDGEWLNNKEEGSGRYIYNNGDIYEGKYKEGQRNGPGKMMIYQTREVRQEVWENGKKKHYRRRGYRLLK